MSHTSRSKFLALLLWGLTACLLVGCAGSAVPSVTEETTPPTSDDPTPTDTPTETPAESEAETETESPVPQSGYLVTDTEGENGPDFIIDFPAGKDVTILQITDTQMQTMADVRNENRRVQISNAFFSVDRKSVV